MMKRSHPNLIPALQSALGFNEPFSFLLFDVPLSYFVAVFFRCITTILCAIVNLCCTLTISFIQADSLIARCLVFWCAS